MLERCVTLPQACLHTLQGGGPSHWRMQWKQGINRAKAPKQLHLYVSGLTPTALNELLKRGMPIREPLYPNRMRHIEHDISHLPLDAREGSKESRLLEAAGATLEAKPVAVGFRVEHPQSLVNGLAYGDLACRVVTGNSRTDKANLLRHPTDEALSRDSDALLPVAAYRLAADVGSHSIYSFCMCPGGQVVPALTKPSEMVVNGMSYSRRHSLFANAALVVSVATDDPCLDQSKGARRVLAFQRSLERKAALLGGGDYVCPVQRLTDFVDRKAPRQRPPPASSYRLGVRETSLHDDLLPDPLADALRAAATGAFERSMPGFVGDDAILHGVETRTSAPLRVVRDDGCESVSLRNLYPCGEGAGYAGGIVSAAVDGLRVARAVLGGHGSDVGAATGVEDPQDVAAVAS